MYFGQILICFYKLFAYLYYLFPLNSGIDGFIDHFRFPGKLFF